MSYANINGHLSSPIYIFRCLRLGSPLLPILFLLVAQVCSTKLSMRRDIEGITVQGADITLLASTTVVIYFLNYFHLDSSEVVQLIQFKVKIF